MARMVTDVPLPGDEIFDAVKRLLRTSRRCIRCWPTRELTSVRIVLNPEKMVIKEAQRIFTYLNLFGYTTDLIVCNRVLPDDVHDAYFAGWKESQRRYRALVGESFAPVPILDVPLFEQEVVGFDHAAAHGRHRLRRPRPRRRSGSPARRRRSSRWARAMCCACRWALPRRARWM